jgi:hypothetical protein
VVQGVDPEFKPQYKEKKKKNQTHYIPTHLRFTEMKKKQQQRSAAVKMD